MQGCCYDVQCTKALVHLMHLCGVDDCYTTCRYRSSTVLLMRKRDNHQSFGPTCNAGQLGQPTMFNVRRGGGLTGCCFCKAAVLDWGWVWVWGWVWDTVFFGFVLQWHSWELNLLHRGSHLSECVAS